ncbi:aquaporin [Sphingomonas sp. IW22]|uniref:aquaporin n=1 Tax=Sphingomonas sp. IW22 TaxID=3242489 RepID=UPI00351FC7B1
MAAWATDRRPRKRQHRHYRPPVPLRSTYARQWRPRRQCTNYKPGPPGGGCSVSLGLALANRFSWKELIPYWIAQVVGAVAAAVVLYAIASGKTVWSAGGFASNGFGDLSPGGYSMQAALLIEIVLTAGFLIVILGATSKAAPSGFAPIAIGLALTLIHLISIPVTNTSVNPARSTGVALFADTAALGQLWLFWVAPLVGAAIGALIWRVMLSPGESPENIGNDQFVDVSVTHLEIRN